MMKFALWFAALLVSGTVCAATAQDGVSSAAEILRVLSRHTGERLTNLVEGRDYKDDSGVWFVQADTTARPSSVSALCEGTRIYAAIRRASPVDKDWNVIETERASVVTIKKEGSVACEKLPASAFFAVSDTVILTDVAMLIDAVDQMQPCARKKDDCKTRVTATPWRLLDTVADAARPPMVLSIDLDPDLSNERLKSYDVSFSMDDSNRRYRAYISIVDGRVKEMDVVQVVQ